MSSQEVVNRIAEAKGKDDAAEKVVLECARRYGIVRHITLCSDCSHQRRGSYNSYRWLDANQGLTDDISCVVVYLNRESGRFTFSPKPAPARDGGSEPVAPASVKLEAR